MCSDVRMIRIMRSFSASFFLLFTKELYSFSFVSVIKTTLYDILGVEVIAVLTPVRCYVRVSTDEQALHGYSLDAQEERLKYFVQSQEGYVIAGWYREEGYSAKDTNRPELKRLLAEAERSDVILVFKLDRLTRSVRDLDDLLKVWEEQGIGFRSTSEQFDTTTATGRLFLRMVAEIAQWERETISERTAEGKYKKAIDGEWTGGRVPFGYVGVPSGTVKRGRELLKLEPAPEHSHLLLEIAEKYLSGIGARAICHWLNNERRVYTSEGARWRVTSLTRMLTNPIYAGYVTYNKRKKDAKTILVKGSHTPLLPEETFQAIQDTFNGRKLATPRQATGKYPLAGLARCGVCGGAVDALRRRNKDGSYVYTYRCHNYINGVGCGDGSVKSLSSFPGKVAEEQLVSLVESLGNPDKLDALYTAITREQEQEQGMSDAEIARLRSDIARSKTAIRRWDEAYENGMPYQEYAERIRSRQQNIAGCEELLSKVKEKPALPKREELASIAVTFRDAWNHLEPQERTAFLRRFLPAWGLQLRLYPDRRLEMIPAPAS